MKLRIPPNEIDAEKALLGSIILRPSSLIDILDIVKQESFYETKHGIIFRAILNINKRNEPIDLVSLSNELKSTSKLDEIGGNIYLSDLAGSTPSTSNIEYYAKIVDNKYTLRRLINIGEEISDIGFSDVQKVDIAVESASNKLINLSAGSNKEDVDIVDIISEFDDTQDLFMKKQFGENKLIGIPTGFSKIDKAIDGLRPGHFWSIAGYTSSGKCHAPGTKILMYNGDLKKVEEINIGDKVMGVDSKPRNVLNLAHGYEEMFEISPLRRESFIVNSGHILSLRRTGTTGDLKHNRKDNIVNITVSDYIDSSKSFKHIHKLWSSGVEFKQEEIPLDPYVFGYWLGNGTKNSTNISTNDSEVVAFFTKYCENNDLRFVYSSGYDYRISGNGAGNIFTKSLKETGAYSDKLIPNLYKINSRENRLQLLAGLLDSDGYLNNTNGNSRNFEFCTVKEPVAIDVVFIARSLGLHASVISRSVVTNFSNGKLCTSYRVIISGSIHIIPTIVKRKQANDYSKRTNELRYGFSVKPVGVGEYYGFQLDGDHLYFTDNLIVHHNTQLLLNIINNVMTEHTVTFFSLEMSKADIISRLIGIESGIGMTKVMRHEFSNEEEVSKFKLARERLLSSKLHIYSKTNSLDSIMLAMSREMLRNKTKLFAIDYIQLVRTGSKSEYEQITEAAQRLQTFARETGCTIIVLSQVSNEHARDPNQEVHGTKGGGSLPASVDMAIELFNEDKKEERDDKVSRGEALSVKAIIKKNRHGRCGYVKLDFTPWNGQFKEDLGWDI